ncbi:MAG: hypothetical protein V1709_10925 [Planctomycetota bacterium]
MRKYHIIITLLIITILFISFYFINNTNKELFYKTESALLEKVEIIKTSSPSIGPDDITEEYHLWLKIEMARNSLEQLTNISNTMLVIRGFDGGDILSNQPETNSNDFGLPLLFSKSITFSTNSIRQLTNNENLSKPRIGFDNIDYQTQIYIKSENDNNLVNLYIHLESNIKSKYLTSAISLTLTHLKNSTTIASKTLPLFRY